MKDENIISVRAETVAGDGSVREEMKDLIMEYDLELCIDGAGAENISCTKSCLAELLAGQLFLKGLIMGAEDIDRIKIDEEAGRADIKVRKVSSGKRQDRAKGVSFERERILALISEFETDQSLHKRTGGTHSCILANKDEILFKCEDISRHNAVDKAIGYALLNDIDLSTCLLFSSGRVAADLILKVINAGIPVLVSKSVPTDRAVKLAVDNKILLICRARGDRYEIYSRP